MSRAADFSYSPLLPIGDDQTEYRLVTDEGVDVVNGPGGRRFLTVDSAVITQLTAEAMHDIAHFLRPAHLAQLRSIIDDPKASPNDRFVALDLLRNANIAAGGVLPMCQDTGTAIVMGKRGRHVLTDGLDEEAIAQGVYQAYTRLNLRYSQLAPLTMWDERNTGSNLPAQIELYAEDPDGQPDAYKFLFMAKGGGSANKSYLYQETKALLNPARMMQFLDEKLRLIGTSACPPYHLAVVIGGTSGEYALKTAKLASAKYLDNLPRHGTMTRARLPRRRAGGGGPRTDPRLRHRRPVRRPLLLPRRTGGPAAPARRVLPGGDRGVLLGRPAGARPRSRRPASGWSGSRPTRRGSCPTSSCRRRTRSCASTSTGRWTRSGPSCRSTR